MYQRTIAKHLATTGYVGRYDSRHIEAWMRLGHGTLDHLTRQQFADEIEIARRCTDADRPRSSATRKRPRRETTTTCCGSRWRGSMSSRRRMHASMRRTDWREGQRVELVHTNDPGTRLQPGTKGTVITLEPAGVDECGPAIHVKWDTGENLGVLPRAGDAIRPLDEPDREVPTL